MKSPAWKKAKSIFLVATAYDEYGNESEYSQELVCNVPVFDTDHDGISDDDEINKYGTDPNSLDTDGDGINDGDELAFWGDDWDGDSDGDGIINLLDADSDGDGTSDGEELNGGYDPADPGSKPLPLVLGEVTVDHTWQRIDFTRSFVNPIVVAKPISFNDADPAVVRIRNVDSSGFEIRVQEWDYLDGIHSEESVSYMVMERGTYTLHDGTRIEAGSFETNKTSSFGSISFGQLFIQVPVVLASVASCNESDAVIGRLRNANTTGFQFRMQEQELNTQSHVAETIDYIAWEPSMGSVDGISFEVDRTADAFTQVFQPIQFTQIFMNIPLVLADMQTADGGDTANLRWRNKDFWQVEFMVSEEQSRDEEMNHTTEAVGYLAVAYTDLNADADGDGLSNVDELEIYGTDPNSADSDGDGINDGEEVDLWGADWSADYDGDGMVNILDRDADGDGFADGVEQNKGFSPADPKSRPKLLEVGEVAVDHQWKRVNFMVGFADPVVVAKPLSSNDIDPAVVRIRNVDSSGFEMRIQEWDYLDGVHSEESVTYMVMERGSFTLDNGIRIEAGKFETDKTSSFGAVSFAQPFNVVPVVMAPSPVATKRTRSPVD